MLNCVLGWLLMPIAIQLYVHEFNQRSKYDEQQMHQGCRDRIERDKSEGEKKRKKKERKAKAKGQVNCNDPSVR